MKWKPEPYLESTGTLLAGIEDYIKDQSDEELIRLSDNCKGATTTNCWCWTYAAAQYLMPRIQGTLMRRKPRAETNASTEN